MALPSLDLVLLLLLLFLAYSSGTEPNPLLHFPRCRSPSSITAAQRLGSAIESQDSGVRPLPDGVAKRANHQSTWLLHRLNVSGSVPKPDRSASGDGSASGGGSGVARIGEVGEDGSEGSVRGASGPSGRPRGLMEICAIR
jgi:hypothetical protein